VIFHILFTRVVIAFAQTEGKFTKYYQVHIFSSQLFVISKTRIHYKNMLRVYKAISSKQILAHNRPALRSFRVYFEGYRCPADTKIKG
jgi:hypothetical protein